MHVVRKVVHQLTMWFEHQRNSKFLTLKREVCMCKTIKTLPRELLMEVPIFPSPFDKAFQVLSKSRDSGLLQLILHLPFLDMLNGTIH